MPVDGRLHKWDPFTGRIAHPVIAVPKWTHLMAAHAEPGGGSSVFLWVDDFARVERWNLQGDILGDGLPATLRAVYNDGDQVMMVCSEPDGAITIQPLPKPKSPWQQCCLEI